MSDRRFHAAGPPTNHSARSRPVLLPGARRAVVLLLSMNLFNYLDRYILAAAVPAIRQAFLQSPDGLFASRGGGSVAVSFLRWFQHTFGFTPEHALIGTLSTAFMVAYMIAAPLCGRLAEHLSRWVVIGVAVMVWSLASGASGFATTFEMLVVTRCVVGIGEAA